MEEWKQAANNEQDMNNKEQDVRDVQGHCLCSAICVKPENN